MLYMRRLRKLPIIQSFGEISHAIVHISFAASFVFTQRLIHGRYPLADEWYAQVAGYNAEGT